MRKIRISRRPIVLHLLVAVLAAATLNGCESTPNVSSNPAVVAQPSFALLGPPPKKSGVQIWSENCMRCHNGRPPQEFSAAQWEVIVHHMRLRANLTGEESREVVKFLQARK
jgi:cytochrome c5